MTRAWPSIAARLLLVLSTLELAAMPARAQDADAPSAAPLAELTSLAEAGDAQAAYLLGLHHASGEGAVRDDSEAALWFRRAADAALPEAQYNLAVMYASGRGVPRDPVQAARWFRLAAMQAHAPAQHALGTLYATGQGVARDEREAARWLREAAEQGERHAQFNLGVFYEYGRGVGIDARAALHWYQRAAASGYTPAIERLAALRERLSAATDAPASAAPASATPGPAKGSVAGKVPRPRAAPRRLAGDAPVPREGASAPVPGAVDALPAGAFVIQLGAHRQRADALAALREHGLGRAGRVIATQVDGQPIHVLLFGAYPDRAAASAAARELSPALRALRPWVRSAESVRAVLARPP